MATNEKGYKYAIYWRGHLVARVHNETGVAGVKNWYNKSQQKHLKVKNL